MERADTGTDGLDWSYLDQASQVLASSLDYETTLASVARLVVPHLACWCIVHIQEDNGEVRHLTVEHVDPEKVNIMLRLLERFPYNPGERIGISAVMRSGQPLLTTEIPAETLARLDPEIRSIIQELNFTSWMIVPMVARGHILGAITLISGTPGRYYTPEDLRMAEELGRRAAIAVDNARLFRQARQAEAETARQLQRLSALRTIDVAVTSSLDIRITLNIVLEQIMQHLAVDAAQVLTLHQETHTLTPIVWRGFRGTSFPRTHLHLGQGHAGQAALERRTITVRDLSQEILFRAVVMREEEFVSYAAVPLLAKGQIQGVVEVFQRTRLSFDPVWLDFLETLAGQAAIAIENLSMFDRLQRANQELIVAYDSTIAGWSHALDLRDKETEGHTQRVTDMTITLARAMGVSETQLVQVRRGALLHDIGKMGIPDAILLKPGPLTEEEWDIMRQHPVHAFELLSSIPYLRAALAIPYSHHEKWDGSGYPRGLMGEQIPLEARIFAVADVWDALTSDRPYRAAWPAERARAYIQASAGTHFDPRVVDAFLTLLRDQRWSRHA